jgi:flagellar motor switch protein FliN/FliY
VSGDSLSQEEIDALLAGAASGDASPPAAAADEAAATAEAVADAPADTGEHVIHVDDAPMPATPREGGLGDRFPDLLGADERDTLGEVGNISMASAATTLSMLLGHQVLITTPTVLVTTEREVIETYERPAALVRIRYTDGLNGSNVFVITTHDASIVADLMMGGPGTPSDEIDEIHASAVGEAMNQMMGAAATSMANMLNHRVDISSPEVTVLDPTDRTAHIGIAGDDEPMVCASFDLTVGDLIKTTLMQLMPLQFAKDLVGALTAPPPAPEPPPPAAEAAPPPPPVAEAPPPPPPVAAPPPPPVAAVPPAPPPVAAAPAPPPFEERPGVVAQPAAFPALGGPPPAPAPGDIGLLLDVPLQVSVELGRTELRIRNVLELVPGSIIELERLAGEPVDVLVNGKQIARGEVVVIDEEFGVRITDIASQAGRLRGLAEG